MYAKILGGVAATAILLAFYLNGVGLVVSASAAAIIFSIFYYYEKPIDIWLVTRSQYAKVIEPTIALRGKVLKVFAKHANDIAQYNLGYQDSRIAHLLGEVTKLKKNAEVIQKVNVTKALSKAQSDENLKLEKNAFRVLNFTRADGVSVISAKNGSYLGKAISVFWNQDNEISVKYLNKRNQVVYTKPLGADEVFPRGWQTTVRNAKTLPIYFDEHNNHVPEVFIGVNF